MDYKGINMSQAFFNPKIRYKITVTKAQRIAIALKVALKLGEVSAIIRAVETLALELTKAEMDTYIRTYVPKDPKSPFSNSLRDSMLKNLKRSKIATKGRLLLWFGTKKKYIIYVNKMPYVDKNGVHYKLQHPNDPQAVSGFFNKGMAHFKTRFTHNLKITKEQLLKAMSIKTKPFTDKLKVKKA